MSAYALDGIDLQLYFILKFFVADFIATFAFVSLTITTPSDNNINAYEPIYERN